MTDLRCAWCDTRFGNRTALNDHEDAHAREERRAVKFYRARLVKAGPFVGVKVWHGAPLVDGEELDRGHRLQALVHTENTTRAVLQTGDDGAPIEVDGVTLRNLTPIKAGEYRYLVAKAAWAEEHKPDHPSANPRKPVDWLTFKPF